MKFLPEQPKLIYRDEIASLEHQLRDQFAIAALTGIIAHGGHIDYSSDRAALAYKYADAMLAARLKK